MKKLRLDVDRLGVESFETSEPQRAGEGTVHGQEQYTYLCGSIPICSTIGASCAVSRCYTCNTCPPPV